MNQQLIFSLRVLICAAIVIGGTAGILWLTGAIRDPSTVHFPDYSLMVSGIAIYGLAALIWWATTPSPKG